MHLNGMPTPPTRDETQALRRVLQEGPAGADVPRSIAPELEADISAHLGELGLSQANQYRLVQAIDNADLAIDGWNDDPSDEGVALTVGGKTAVIVRSESADFLWSTPAGTTATPETDGGHRLDLPAVVTATPRAVRKEVKPLGMCPECYNILNPDGTCPMECEQPS